MTAKSKTKTDDSKYIDVFAMDVVDDLQGANGDLTHEQVVERTARRFLADWDPPFGGYSDPNETFTHEQVARFVAIKVVKQACYGLKEQGELVASLLNPYVRQPGDPKLPF
jgi:predicted ArsR family transcriptional regulator